MDSPFKPIPAHEHVAPIWRLLAQFLLLIIAAFVAAVLLGLVEVRLAEDRPAPSDSEKKGSSLNRVCGEAPFA